MMKKSMKVGESSQDTDGDKGMGAGRWWGSRGAGDGERRFNWRSWVRRGRIGG